jgi:hypothetical protein
VASCGHRADDGRKSSEINLPVAQWNLAYLPHAKPTATNHSQCCRIARIRMSSNASIRQGRRPESNQPNQRGAVVSKATEKAYPQKEID